MFAVYAAIFVGAAVGGLFGKMVIGFLVALDLVTAIVVVGSAAWVLG